MFQSPTDKTLMFLASNHYKSRAFIKLCWTL